MIALQLTKRLHAASGSMDLHISLEITKGEFVTLYGESGSGKTSILRMLAGLMAPDRGKITVDQRVWYDADHQICLSPQQRNVGFVFQDYALFPHMTVRQNLEFAFRKGADRKIMDELVRIMELEELQRQKPGTLSGGQKQRVALARALVRQPRLLMLDEPLSALDYKMRGRLQQYLQDAHRTFGLTTILVSHDPGEIIKLSDRVFELHQGQIIREERTSEFFRQGKTSAKFTFTGEIVAIEKEDIIYVITILVGNDIVKVVADESEIGQFAPGDKVTVGSKAFNPIIQKI